MLDPLYINGSNIGSGCIAQVVWLRSIRGFLTCRVD